MRIALFGRTFEKACFPYVKLILKKLEDNNVSYCMTHALHQFLSKNGFELSIPTFESKSELAGVDYAFSIGGDGSLLEAATLINDLEIPVLGINAGRLGFMATVQIENIEAALDEFFEERFSLSERILVQVTTDQNLFGEFNYGLNEFAIQKRDTSSMIVIHAYINGEFLNSYWADGIIVSTPTGSTGYSLSCGGPLVMPQTNNFILAPVNPHNLNVRPLIVPDDCTLTFKIEGRSKNFLVSLDHRSRKAEADVEITISKAGFKAKLIELKDSNYFNILRNKLNWGLDARN